MFVPKKNPKPIYPLIVANAAPTFFRFLSHLFHHFAPLKSTHASIGETHMLTFRVPGVLPVLKRPFCHKHASWFLGLGHSYITELNQGSVLFSCIFLKNGTESLKSSQRPYYCFFLIIHIIIKTKSVITSNSIFL